MKVKILEVRDIATFIPMLCIDINPDEWRGDSPEVHAAQRYLLRRCGYPCDYKPNIAMTKLNCGGDLICNDMYYWNDRTFRVAHEYITEHWDELSDGDVVDIEFILGETKEPKKSERFEYPL